MQCYEFELLRIALDAKLREIGVRHGLDPLDAADLLIEHDVTSFEDLAEVVSIARNARMGLRLVA